MNTEQRARFEAYAQQEDLDMSKSERGWYANYVTNVAACTFMEAETPLLARIAELESDNEMLKTDVNNKSVRINELRTKVISLARLPTQEEMAKIIAMKSRIAELEGQLANREPFVVKMPLSISVLISDGLHADFMLNSEIKAAITAAGGRCVCEYSIG